MKKTNKPEEPIATISIVSFKSMSKPQRKRFIAWLRECADWYEKTKWNFADDYKQHLMPLE